MAAIEPAEDEVIPLVLDLSDNWLIPKESTGPHGPARKARINIFKNVNGYLRRFDGLRDRPLRSCISPGYGAFVTHEIFEYFSSSHAEYFGFQIRNGRNKPIHARTKAPIKVPEMRVSGNFSASTGQSAYLKCSVDIIIPVLGPNPRQWIGMRVNASISGTMHLRNGDIDMWIGTTDWDNKRHAWVQAMEADGLTIRTLTLQVPKDKDTKDAPKGTRIPVKIDMNEHPAFAQQQHAQPMTFEQLVAADFTRSQNAKERQRAFREQEEQEYDATVVRHILPRDVAYPQGSSGGLQYGQGPYYSSSRYIDPTQTTSALMSSLSLSGPLAPSFPGGQARPRGPPHRRFTDRDSPDDGDRLRDEAGHPTKVRQYSRAGEQQGGDLPREHRTTSGFSGPGSRSILNPPSPVAESGVHSGPQGHDRRQGYGQERRSTRDERGRDVYSSRGPSYRRDALDEQEEDAEDEARRLQRATRPIVERRPGEYYVHNEHRDEQEEDEARPPQRATRSDGRGPTW